MILGLPWLNPGNAECFGGKSFNVSFEDATQKNDYKQIQNLFFGRCNR
jgi:hypothetical protein